MVTSPNHNEPNCGKALNFEESESLLRVLQEDALNGQSALAGVNLKNAGKWILSISRLQFLLFFTLSDQLFVRSVIFR
jgi:hypothetical protein